MELKTESKKSAIDLTSLGISIVVLGIAVALGVTILINIRNQQVTNIATYQIANESITSVTETGEYLTYGWVKSVDIVINHTGHKVLTAANWTYTVNSGNGKGLVTSIGGDPTFNNSDWNVTYTVYNTSDPRYTIPDKSSIGLSEYGNWFKLLVIVGAAAVVIALILMAISNKNNSNASINY